MTMRADIKFMIEEIMRSEVSDVESAVNSACDKVDEVIDTLENILSNAVSDLTDPDQSESVKDELQKAYDEI